MFALTAAMTMPALLLRKPHRKSKTKDHIKCLIGETLGRIAEWIISSAWNQASLTEKGSRRSGSLVAMLLRRLSDIGGMNGSDGGGLGGGLSERVEDVVC